LRIGLFDNDDALAFDDLGFDRLLFVRFQIASVLGLLTHALNCVHDVALLRKKCVSKIRGPLDIVCKTVHHIRQSGQCLDAWVPRLLCHRIGQGLVLQRLVLLEPLLQLDDFERIRGSGKSLSQQRVGI
jgi:hypothetical protein